MTRPCPRCSGLGYLPDSPGARIRAARIAAGLTQAEVAERLGVTSARICNIEHNRGGLSWEALRDLARALETTATDLVRGDEVER